MFRTLLAAAIVAALSATAFASYAPIKYAKSRAELASICEKLGPAGKGYGLESSSGAYGCQNTETGAAVQCTADGQCTDYSADFRWKKIQEILHGGKPQKQALTPISLPLAGRD